MEESHDVDSQVVLFLEGLKGQFSMDILTEIDVMLDQHFEEEIVETFE